MTAARYEKLNVNTVASAKFDHNGSLTGIAHYRSYVD